MTTMMTMDVVFGAVISASPIHSEWGGNCVCSHSYLEVMRYHVRNAWVCVLCLCPVLQHIHTGLQSRGGQDKTIVIISTCQHGGTDLLADPLSPALLFLLLLDGIQERGHPNCTVPLGGWHRSQFLELLLQGGGRCNGSCKQHGHPFIDHRRDDAKQSVGFQFLLLSRQLFSPILQYLNMRQVERLSRVQPRIAYYLKCIASLEASRHDLFMIARDPVCDLFRWNLGCRAQCEGFTSLWMEAQNPNLSRGRCGRGLTMMVADKSAAVCRRPVE